MSTAPTARLPRRPPLRVLAWVALVLVSVVAGLAHAGPASAASTTLFGFNDWNDASNYYLQPQLGMPVRRMILGWNEVQPTQGAWDWSGSDAVYSSLLANGLRPLIVIQSAPCWANATLPCSDAANGALPPDSAHLGDWATFISRLAQRYPAAVGIEIWNEENLTYEWLPYPDPVAYTAVLKAADDAVKAVAPNMPVISGGLFVSGQSGPDGMADGAFLGGMYSAGAKGHFDGIGIHPYPIAGGWDGTPIRVDTSIVEQSLDTLRTARDAAGDSSTPLWVTEIGVSTQSLVGSAPATDETDQAAELLWMLSRLKADSDVAVVLIHRLIDQPVAPGDPAAGYDGYGIFNPDGTPKAAACQLSLLFGGTLHCPGVSLMTSAMYTPPAVTGEPSAPAATPSTPAGTTSAAAATPSIPAGTPSAPAAAPSAPAAAPVLAPVASPAAATPLTAKKTTTSTATRAHTTSLASAASGRRVTSAKARTAAARRAAARRRAAAARRRQAKRRRLLRSHVVRATTKPAPRRR